MWKSFGSRNDRDGDRKQETAPSSGRRRHRTDDDSASVITSATRRTDSSRKKRHHDRDETERDRRSGREGTSGLTESAVRALDENDEAWEDDEDNDDMKSERRRKRSSKSRSERDEKDRRKERERPQEPERRRTQDDVRDRDLPRMSVDQKSAMSKLRGKYRAEELANASESERALPAMGSFDQFPGMYDAAIVRPPRPPEHTMSGALPLDSHIASQFPGQMPTTYSAPAPQLRPGAAAEYYNDQGESVQHQPGVRPSTPMMLHNPDTHLITPSAAANPVADTGSGTAADFYGGRVSPVAFQAQPTSGPGSSPAVRPGKKPGGTTAAAATAATTAAISGLVGKQSHRPSAATTPSKPSRHNSAPSFAPGGAVYTTPPAVTGKLNGAHSHANNTGLYTAAGAAALGAAAYGISQQHSSNGTNHQSSERPYGPSTQESHDRPHGRDTAASYDRPYGQSTQDSYYAPPGGSEPQMYNHQHEQKGPIERIKDGILDMIADPDDVRKMEAYTEYIGVCKDCFDPRTSPWDGPRRHHYHPRKRDSFDSLRRRLSSDRLRRKSSGERLGGTTRIEKETRYAASESSKKRQGMSKAEMAGLGALGAGAVTTGAMLWRDGRDFDDTYSVKSGRRADSSARRTSRSSSRERRRRSSYGVIGPDRQEKEKWVTVRTRDGRTERRKVLARSRSRSRSHGSRDRDSGWAGAAAGAALGAAAIGLAKSRSSDRPRKENENVYVRRRGSVARSRSRSSSPGKSTYGSSKDKRSKHSGRRSPVFTHNAIPRPRPGSRQDKGIFGAFFAEPKSHRSDRKKERGFFAFGNGSASSLDSELAFGEGFASRSSLGRKASNASLKTKRKPTRRTSQERMTAAVAGIGATAAALAAAQRGQRLSRYPSKPELGARREAREIVDGRTVDGAEDEGWEDELPSDVDDASSHDGDLAFGEHERRGRMSRQSMESIASNSFTGGLSAWGWRWGGKRKTPRKASVPSQQHSHPQHYAANYNVPPSNVTPRDFNRQASSSDAPPPLRYVDPRPLYETAPGTGSQHATIPGAFDSYDSPPLSRPSAAPLQQPQPIAPISPAFTQGLNDDPLRSMALSRMQTKPRRTQSSPTRNGYGNLIGDAALIGGAAIATAGIIASQNKKAKDSGNVRFGLTDEQQRKDDESRRREHERQLERDLERAAEERWKAERAEVAREEARRAALERDREREAEERRKAERAEAIKEEARRIAREENERRIQEQERRAREAEQEAERRTREAREREYAIIAAAAEEERRRTAARRVAEEQADLDKRQREIAEHGASKSARAQAAEEEARHKARTEAQQQVQRQADERDGRTHDVSRDLPDTRDVPRRADHVRRKEEDRAFEEEEDRERRRRDKQRETDEQDRFDTEDRHSKKSKRKSSLSRDAKSKESTIFEPSEAWQGPTAAGIAGAVTGAMLNGARNGATRRTETPDEHQQGRETSPEHLAQIIEPSNEHSGAPITDDDLFDPMFFSKRKRSQSEVARHVELSRKAAEKVISDREAYYNAPAQTQAEIFAPPELLKRAAGEKERSTDPMGGNEVQVWHAPEAEVRQHFEHPLYAGDHADDPLSWLSKAVPRLNVIAPTPPPTQSTFQKPKLEQQASAGVARNPEPSEKDLQHQRPQRAVSWGQDQTHIYQVQTPDSMIDRDSYMSSHDVVRSASTPLHDEIVVEEADEDGNSRTKRYGEDDLTKSTSDAKSTARNVSSSAENDDNVEEIDREADDADEDGYFAAEPEFQYKQPALDKFPDLNLAMESPGTEGAPPVRGWVDDEEVTGPTPKDEKVPKLPLQSTNNARGEHKNALESEERDFDRTTQPAKQKTADESTSKFASLVGAAMASVGLASATKPAEPDREVGTPVVDDTWEPPLSKKEKKKREKLAKRSSGSEDIVSNIVALADEHPKESVAESQRDVDEDLPLRTLSKKDKKKRDKAAKRSVTLDSDTNAAETNQLDQEEPSDVKPAFADDFAYEIPLSKKEKKKREKLAKQGLSFDDDSVPSTPASEHEEPDLNKAAVAEDVDQRPLTGTERDRADKSFTRRQGIGSVVDAMMTAGGIAALAGASNRVSEKSAGRNIDEIPTNDDDLWDTPSKKDKKSKKKKLGVPLDRDVRDVEPTATEGDIEDSQSSESHPTKADKRSSMPGGWDDDEPRREDGKSSDRAAAAIPVGETTADGDDVWSGYETKRSKKKKNKRNSVYNEPPVRSPLRSEVQHDDYITSRGLAEVNDSRAQERSDQGSSKEDVEAMVHQHRPTNSLNGDDESKYRASDQYMNGFNGISESPREMSPARRNNGAHSNYDLMQADDDADRPAIKAALDKSDGSDVEELVGDRERSGSKRRKRRSRYEDDDAMSTVSSQSKRDKEDLSQPKEKKSGILGSLFGRKSSEAEPLSKSSTRERRGSREDDESDSRSHRRRRTGSEYGEDDDTRSVTSSGRKHRHRGQQDDDGDDRHRHRYRDEDDADGSRHRHRSRDLDKTESRSLTDQSFLGDRVEILPPLPDSRPASPASASREVEQDEGNPASVEVTDANKRSKSWLKEEAQGRSINDVELADLPPLPDSPPRSPLALTEPHYRPFPVRPTASTAVPLRFKQPPPSPQAQSRSGNTTSPVESAVVSPASAQRQKSSRGRTDTHSGEYKPLYLAERHSKPPPPIEDDLPSLPSSKPSSRASSVQDSEDYHSAAEDIYSSPMSQRQLRLDTDNIRSRRSEEDILDSQQTTPRASEFARLASETNVRREPQFYDWEDLMREQARSSQHDAQDPVSKHRTIDHDIANLPALPESPPTSPSGEGRGGHTVEALAAGVAVLAGLTGLVITDRQHSEQLRKQESSASTTRGYSASSTSVPEQLDSALPVDEAAVDTASNKPASDTTSKRTGELVRQEETETSSLSATPVLPRKASRKAAKKAKKAAQAWSDDDQTPPTPSEEAAKPIANESVIPDTDQAERPATVALGSEQHHEMLPLEQPPSEIVEDVWDEPGFQTKKKKKGKKGKQSTTLKADLDTTTIPQKIEPLIAAIDASNSSTNENKVEHGAVAHISAVDNSEGMQRSVETKRLSEKKDSESGIPLLDPSSASPGHDADVLELRQKPKSVIAHDVQPTATIKRTEDQDHSTQLSASEQLPMSERALKDFDHIREQASSIQLPDSPKLRPDQPEMDEDGDRAMQEDVLHSTDFAGQQQTRATGSSALHTNSAITQILPSSTVVANFENHQQEDSDHPELQQPIAEKDTIDATQDLGKDNDTNSAIYHEAEEPSFIPVLAPKMSEKHTKKQKNKVSTWEEEQVPDMPEASKVRDVPSNNIALFGPDRPQLATEIALPDSPAPTAEDEFYFAPVKRGKKGKKTQKGNKLDLWADHELKPETQAESTSSAPDPQVEEVLSAPELQIDTTPAASGSQVETTPAAPESQVDRVSTAPAIQAEIDPALVPLPVSGRPETTRMQVDVHDGGKQVARELTSLKGMLDEDYLGAALNRDGLGSNDDRTTSMLEPTSTEQTSTQETFQHPSQSISTAPEGRSRHDYDETHASSDQSLNTFSGNSLSTGVGQISEAEPAAEGELTHDLERASGRDATIDHVALADEDLTDSVQHNLGTNTREVPPEPVNPDLITGSVLPELADSNDTTEGVDSTISFVTKRSKKEKRKSKKEPGTNSVVSSEPSKGAIGLISGATIAAGAAIATAAAIVMPSDTTKPALIVMPSDTTKPATIVTPPETTKPDEETLWELPAKKQSKKEKRKSKKSAWVAFDAEDDNTSSATEEVKQATVMVEDEASESAAPSLQTHDVETVLSEPPVAKVLEVRTMTDLKDAASLPLPEPSEDELTIAHQRERAATPKSMSQLSHERYDDGPEASKTKTISRSEPAQDLEFAATLAAGLHESGFDPNLVVDDPIFHRRASPPDLIAEADPQESGAFGPTKRRKNEGRTASQDSEEPSERLPATRMLTSASSLQQQDDDFDAVLSRGLSTSGFDATLLQNAGMSSHDVSSNEQQEESDLFAPVKTKRKKNKKSKLMFDYEGETESSPLTTTPLAPVADVKEIEPVRAEVAAPPKDQKAPEPVQPTESIHSSTPEVSRDIDQSVILEETAQQTTTTEWDFPTKKKGKKGKNKVASIASLMTENIPVVLTEEDTSADISRAEPAEGIQSGSAAALSVDREMDVGEMEQAYKAYKKNKRRAKKERAVQSLSSPIGATAVTSSEDTPQDLESAEPAEETAQPQSRASTPDQRRPRGSKVVVHTSEASQSLPRAVDKSPLPIYQSIEDQLSTTDSLPHDVEQPSQHSDRVLEGMLAAGAVMAAGNVLSHHGAEHSHDVDALHHTSRQVEHSSRPPADEPAWSFSALQDDNQQSSGMSPHSKDDAVRDSGYQEVSTPVSERAAAAASSSADNSIPEIRPIASHESLSSRRSLDPLHIDVNQDASWNMPVPKQRSQLQSQGQLQAPRSRTPSYETPLEPTSRNRASYLFQTPPETTPEARHKHTPLQDDAASQSHHETASLLHADTEETDRSTAMSPLSRVASPRGALDSIPEESHTSKRSIEAASFVPVQPESESRRRTFSPETGLVSTGDERSRHARELSPADSVKRRVVSSPLDSRMYLDGDVNIKSVHRGVSSEVRSPSVLSARSNISNGIRRIPEELRSFSRASSDSHTPVLRRISMSGDLRAASRASNRRGDTGSGVGAHNSPRTIPFKAPPTPPLYDEDLIDQGASRAMDMADVYQGYGDRHESHVSPTRPPSMRKRQSMHIIDLESRLDQLTAENRALAEARRGMQDGIDEHGLRRSLEEREFELREKDVELHRIRTMLGPMQAELERLMEINDGLTEANRNLVDDTNGRYATLQAEHEHAHQQWQNTSRELDTMRSQQISLASDVRDAIAPELNAALAEKDGEIRRLREELEVATERIRALQVQIQSSKEGSFLVQRDEDYFDGACQKLCQHAQQWVLRFSKTSDNRICRLSSELKDEKIETRLDNAILDGSDVDKLLGDRVKRRDVLMSVVTTMIWEYVFTRYLFGMDREQRQKLKALEKTLAEVGPPRAVAQWRATTLTLLCKRSTFEEQCRLDTEAVTHEIFGVLCSLLPPPTSAEQQLLQSLQRVVKIAVDLSVEMRTQRAEYIMLPPLQPEYDEDGDLRSKMHFNAALMNERSGSYSSNEELEAERAVVRIVLFPPIIKKGDDFGEGAEETVVCPAQVLVHSDNGKGKKVVRMMSGAMEIDDPRVSRQSLISAVPGNSALS